MTRGKNLMVALAVAGPVVLGIGASSPPAWAQVYPACAPGYYYAAGYCYPTPRLTTRPLITTTEARSSTRASVSALVSAAASIVSTATTSTAASIEEASAAAGFMAVVSMAAAIAKLRWQLQVAQGTTRRDLRSACATSRNTQ